MKHLNLSKNTYNNTIQNYINERKSFEVHTTMNSSVIISNEVKYKCIQNYQRIDGAHLIGVLKKSVESKLESGFIPPSGFKQPIVDYFNLYNIEANLNEIVTVIDLKAAYWTAAYRLGYLNSYDYYSTWHIEEWKNGKVAAVGCLNKSVYVDVYKDGELIEKGKLVQTDKLMQNVRLHILNYIHDLMCKLASLADTSFLSIQTDAITMVAEPKHLAKVFKEIADCGFKYKLSKIIFHEVQNYNILASHFPSDDVVSIKYGESNIWTGKGNKIEI